MKPGFGSGLFFSFLAAVIFGSQFPVAKDVYASIDAFHMNVVRYGVSVLLLLVFLAWREGRAALRFDGRGLQTATIGLIGMTASPLLVFGGLMLTRPEVAAVVVATQPAMAAIAEWLIDRRRPPGFTIACIAVAFLGVFTIVTRWSVDLAPQGAELAGDLMILVGAFCWVVYTLASARFRSWSPLRFTALTMLVGALGTVTVTAIAVAAGLLDSPPAARWMAVMPQLFFLTLIGVLLGMIAWNLGARRVGGLNAVLFLNLAPVVAFSIGWWQGRRFEPIEIGGAALVIVALVANNLYVRRVAARAPVPAG